MFYSQILPSDKIVRGLFNTAFIIYIVSYYIIEITVSDYVKIVFEVIFLFSAFWCIFRMIFESEKKAYWIKDKLKLINRVFFLRIPREFINDDGISIGPGKDFKWVEITSYRIEGLPAKNSKEMIANGVMGSVLISFVPSSMRAFDVFGEIVLVCLILTLSLVVLSLFIISFFSVFNELKPSRPLYLIGLAFLLFSGFHGYSAAFGKEEIGSFFEKKEYEAYYYVRVYNHKKSNKSYDAIAKLKVGYLKSFIDEEYSSHFSERVIDIEKLYLPGRGSISLTSESEYGLIMEKTILCLDEYDKEWYIQLTNRQAKKPD